MSVEVTNKDPLTDNQYLGRLVRSWRERLDPEAVAGLSVSRRRKKVVSQEDIARLIGSSSHWYARLERGDTDANFSDDFLERAAAALDLQTEERQMMFLLSVGREPAAKGTLAPMRLTEPLRRFIEMQPYPTCILDCAWEVIAYNKRMADWFPWVADGTETNGMRWVFTDPAARVQLRNWDTHWAPLLLEQMRAAYARNPHNSQLARLIREILHRSDFAQEQWASGAAVHVHSDGDRRQLYVPRHDQIVDIELVALAPMRAPEVRVTTLIPVAECARAEVPDRSPRPSPEFRN